jgi:cytochrome oxidase Cu insertion factor (SCO1/SenC/PrrC family)
MHYGRLARPPLAAWAAGLLALILLAAPSAAPAGEPSTIPGSPPGSTTPAPAPNFTVTLLDGKTLSLADLKGKSILLNFWWSK